MMIAAMNQIFRCNFSRGVTRPLNPQGDVVATDVVVMRPALLAATVLGSAIFVVSLPVAAVSKQVKSAANTLVVAPAQATFTRPLGEFDYHEKPSEYSVIRWF